MSMKICGFCGKPISGPDCPHCGADDTRKNYEDLETFRMTPPAKSYFEKIRFTDWLEKMEAYMPFICKEISKDTKTVVDLGCGPNEAVRLIKERFPSINAVGYDKITRHKDAVSLDFETESLPFGDSEIDLVILSHVLEHVDNLHFVLAEAFRVGKKILIVLPNCIHFFSLVKAFFSREMGSLSGMPVIKPVDRHKWFFRAKEADVLMGCYAAKYNRRYEVHYFTHPKAITILNRLSPNLFCHEMLYVFTPDKEAETG